MDENIDWIKIENEIKSIKFPLSFIFKLFKYNNHLSDNNLSITIRYFFKHHYRIVSEYNLMELFIMLDNSKYTTIKIIFDFYNLIRKKIYITKLIIIWKDIHKNKNFWNLSLNKQIEDINNLRNLFLSNFDVSNSSILFHNKAYLILKDNPNNDFIIENIIERLRNVYLLFTRKFFTKFKILTISRIKFLEIDIESKIKYCSYIFNKINKILFTLYNNLLIYKYIENQLNNLLNPSPIIFNNRIVNSETDIDDILFIIKS